MNADRERSSQDATAGAADGGKADESKPVSTPAGSGGNPRPKKQFLVTIYRSWCKKCRLCVDLCPRKVFDADAMNGPIISRQPDCTGCLLCELQCPDLAIRIDRVISAEGG